MKLKRPKISVVMAVHNGENYLVEAIESILNQTFKEFEFIIVDDASQDKSLNIMKNYSKKDKRIKIIKNKKNLRLAASLNKGLRAAKGKYIARMDADDISFPRRLEIQEDYLNKNENVFLVGGGVLNIDEKGKKLITLHPLTNSKKIMKKIINRNLLYHPTIMFRNEKGIKYRKKFLYAQDYDLYLNLVSKGKKLDNLPQILIKYRAITSLNAAKQFLFAEKARQFYYQRERLGRDNYNSFDPSKIINLNVKRRKEDIKLVRAVIFSAFNSGDLSEVRRISREYLSKKGLFNSIFIYYIISFLNIKIINLLIKIYKILV